MLALVKAPSTTLALVAKAPVSALSSRSEAGAGQPKEERRAPKDEVRFCELVPMIHDWVQRSFTPLQEERMQRKGRLCARFQVNLGKKMAEHLQAYVKASFALKLLLVRVRELESKAPKPPQEVVEIVMSPEARTLYAEKNPQAVQKFQQQLATVESSTDGLVDADGDEDLQGPQPMTIEDNALAIEDGEEGAAPKKRRHAAALGDGGAGATVQAGDADATGRTPEKPEKKRARATGGSGGANVDAKAPSGAAEAVGTKQMPAQPKEAATKIAALVAAVGGTGSIWEKVEANDILPGQVGLVEAREALSDSLSKKALGGMEAFKAEREAVAWLKGLLECEVGPTELKDTRIGVVVNEWRKHSEPYISRLATALLASWKKAWRGGAEKTK